MISPGYDDADILSETGRIIRSLQRYILSAEIVAAVLPFPHS
jgi:hypothetical protein